LAESTEKAIDYKIAQEFNDLTDAIHRYVVEQESAANSRELALIRGYQHLKIDLVPEMLDRVITFCLDVGVRDPDRLAAKIKNVFEGRLVSLGRSLAVSYQTPSAGTTMYSIQQFKGWVSVYCASNIAARVLPAVVRRQHMDPPPSPPPAPPTSTPGSGHRTISVNQSGGVTAQSYVVNNHNYGGPGLAPEKNEANEEHRFRITTRIAVMGLLVAILVGLVAFAAWRWPRESMKAPLSSVAGAPSQQPTSLSPPVVAPTTGGPSTTSPLPARSGVSDVSRQPIRSSRKGRSVLDKKTGDTVISIGQQGGITAHTVIQNNTRRIIRKDVGAEWGTRDATGKQILRLTFHQSDGIWEPGTKFWLQVDLSGPYERAEMQGFPRALFEAGMTEGGSTAAAQGKFEFTTITPPIAAQDIVLEIESVKRLDVRSIRLSPSEGQ
jgi:hypothetical protein